MPAFIRSITMDCEHPARLARFWAEALGYHVRAYDDAELARLRSIGIDDVENDPSVAIDPPNDSLPAIFFAKVPEPKTVKNRMHLDIAAPKGMAAEVRRLTLLGATVVRPFDEDIGMWTVMADPEGNEFCVEER
jgi:predicted enzyme related to lactoylglutathione lyase